MFTKATKHKVNLKLAITGQAGAGKTRGAMELASGISDKRFALIDTENGSASLYADRYDFDVLNCPRPVDIQQVCAAIRASSKDYEVIVIDSASAIWEAVLDFKSKLDAKGGNSYTNWGVAGKLQQDFINAVLETPVHVICTLRSKMEYVLETNEKGKSAPRKIGTAPIFRENHEYEFSTVFDIGLNHLASCDKDRSELFLNKVFQLDKSVGKQLSGWLIGETDTKTIRSATVSDISQPDPIQVKKLGAK